MHRTRPTPAQIKLSNWIHAYNQPQASPPHLQIKALPSQLLPLCRKVESSVFVSVSDWHSLWAPESTASKLLFGNSSPTEGLLSESLQRQPP